MIRDVFAKQYADRVILVEQSPVTSTGRFTPATFLGFLMKSGRCLNRKPIRQLRFLLLMEKEPARHVMAGVTIAGLQRVAERMNAEIARLMRPYKNSFPKGDKKNFKI